MCRRTKIKEVNELKLDRVLRHLAKPKIRNPCLYQVLPLPIPSGFPVIDLSEHPQRPAHYPLTMEDLYFRSVALEVFKRQPAIVIQRFDYDDLTNNNNRSLVSLAVYTPFYIHTLTQATFWVTTSFGKLAKFAL